jgi:cellulose synthase/poly-beta-1,6-N-acetylglucosamine synthase-like glycosyltransferase
MKWVFGLSLAMIAYAYFGYPLWLFLRTRLRSRPIRPAPIFPFVSIVLAVHNEEKVLPAKLRNLAKLNYPEDRFEVVVISDGSTDGTNRILEANLEKHLRVIISPAHEGKACALNHGIQAAQGQIIVFTDARQIIEPEAVRCLVANFADPTVGCVSGELMLGRRTTGAAADGVGYYWNLEKKIRQWEGVTGSVIGATGALYAVRKQLLVPLPPATILDDLFIPLHVARQGGRVIFEPGARAWDSPATSLKHEFRRKVRTLTGNYQLLRLAPWVLTRANPVRIEFISHKLLRLLVPFALLAFLVSSVLLQGVFYELCVGFQLVFYALGALGFFRPKSGFIGRLANVAMTFLMLNTAAAVAFVHFVTGKKEVWVQ